MEVWHGLCAAWDAEMITTEQLRFIAGGLFEDGDLIYVLEQIDIMEGEGHGQEEEEQT